MSGKHYISEIMLLGHKAKMLDLTDFADAMATVTDNVFSWADFAEGEEGGEFQVHEHYRSMPIMTSEFMINPTQLIDVFDSIYWLVWHEGFTAVVDPTGLPSVLQVSEKASKIYLQLPELPQNPLLWAQTETGPFEPLASNTPNQRVAGALSNKHKRGARLVSDEGEKLRKEYRCFEQLLLAHWVRTRADLCKWREDCLAALKAGTKNVKQLRALLSKRDPLNSKLDNFLQSFYHYRRSMALMLKQQKTTVSEQETQRLQVFLERFDLADDGVVDSDSDAEAEEEADDLLAVLAGVARTLADRLDKLKKRRVDGAALSGTSC